MNTNADSTNITFSSAISATFNAQFDLFKHIRQLYDIIYIAVLIPFLENVLRARDPVLFHHDQCVLPL